MRPDAFAAVMATGIVSIAAAAHRFVVVSDTLAVLAVIGLLVLTVAAGLSWSRKPPDIADPDVAVRLFTFVAACAVLDTRLASIPAVAWMLAALAMAAWLLVGALTARSFARHRWVDLRERACDAWELASVGTSGLAIVIVSVALHTGSRAALAGAAGLWALAMVLYLAMTSLILARAFAARLDPVGFEPDSWILMGALAIATLAGDRIHYAATSLECPAAVTAAIETASVTLWAGATLWLVPLTCFLIVRMSRVARKTRFAGVWWTMVFPLGMYSAATHATTVEMGWSALEYVSLTFFFIAFCAWLLVAWSRVRALTL